MRITNTLARIAAAFFVTVLLNGAVLAAFDGVAARGASAQSAGALYCPA
jgi:hypothetical protein